MTTAAHRGNSNTSYVVVARHGERLDYVMRDRGENWIPTADRPWDPPLSEHGMEQGGQLGRHLSTHLPELSLPALTTTYSSPLLRCRQTAVAAMRGYNDAMESNNNHPTLPKVCIEVGLAESINESWYRSWALPYSNGTWGLRAKGETEIDNTTLKAAAKKPALDLLDWKEVPTSANEDAIRPFLDLDHISATTLDKSYQLYPRQLESQSDQQRRMRQTVNLLARPGETVLLVSHGGPVTHLYEELTGNDWKVHGESSYCCYSIYQRTKRGVSGSDEKDEWEAIQVNQADYLHEEPVHEQHVS